MPIAAQKWRSITMQVCSTSKVRRKKEESSSSNSCEYGGQQKQRIFVFLHFVNFLFFAKNSGAKNKKRKFDQNFEFF